MKDNSAINELKTVTFLREQVLKYPKEENIPTLLDADEHKLLALNKLLEHIYLFSAEMNSVGLTLQASRYDLYEKLNMFQLTDAEFAQGIESFDIIVRSDFLDPKDRGRAVHSGFKFLLFVRQNGYHGEIADWIRIQIQYLDTTPFSLASQREHVLCLESFVRDAEFLYFNSIPMRHASTVSFDRLDDGLSFSTTLFNESVDDACTVIQKLISRKDKLSMVFEEKRKDS